MRKSQISQSRREGFRLLRSLVALVLLASTVAIAPGAIGAQDGDDAGAADVVTALFDEDLDGEISGDAANPTALQLDNGPNLIVGSVVLGNIDYVTVNVPEGHELSGLDLVEYTSEGDRSFIGVQEGTVFTETPEEPEVGNLLGFTLFGDATGVDLLPPIGTGEGAQGFTGSLSAGDYTFWIQEIGDAPAEYYLDFIVSPVADAAPADDAADDGGVSALFDEDVDGEISGDAANPTALQLDLGANIVAGSVVLGNIDYVTVNVPEGHELANLSLVDYNSEGDRSFIGVQEGTVFTETPEEPEVGNLLGFTLFGDATGVDLLPAIGTGEGAQGFSGSLSAGDYTFWIQEIGDAPAEYYLDFNVAPVADDAADDDSADDAPVASGDAVQFTFENLQPDDGFFFTEAWVGLHNGDFDLFNDGERATPGLEALAEGGNTELLGAEFAAGGRLQTTIGNGEVQFISPGEVIEGSIDIRNAAAYQYASFASMIIPSNDAFFGNEDPLAYRIFDENGNFTGDVEITIYGQDIYDSGTEVNDGQGAAGFSLGLNGDGGESTDDPTGVVGAHPDLLENIIGFGNAAGTTIGSDGSGAIALDEAVARITITVGDSINTQSAVGPLFDGSVVEDAPADDAPADDSADDAPADDAADDDAPADDAAAPTSFRIVDGEFGRYLEASFGNAATSNVAHTTTEWEVVDAGDGDVYIQNAYTRRFLATDGSGAVLDDADGEYIRWQLADAGDGSYYIINTATEALLQAERPRFNVSTGTEPSAATRWTLVPAE